MDKNRLKFENGKLQVPDNPVIPFIEGDGIGAEITAPTLRTIDTAVEKAYGSSRWIVWKEILAGDKAHRQTGEWLPEKTFSTLKNYLVGLKGPLMTPVGEGKRSLNVILRQVLDLFACVRPIRWFEGIPAPVKRPDLVNLVIFRENTEDIYAGIEFPLGEADTKRFEEFLLDEMKVSSVRFPGESAYGIKPVSKPGSERLIRAALQYAVQHQLSSVTLVHKGNIMKYTEGAFRKWGYELAEREFGNQITIKDMIADAFFQDMLLRPEEHSLVATLNLNGDYISDMAAAMVGGIGIAPGANINYETGRAIFEATHGTAPNIVGQDIANPVSLMLSGMLLLEYIGWQEAAELLNNSIVALYKNQMGTKDLFAKVPGAKVVGTQEFSELLQKHIKSG